MLEISLLLLIFILFEWFFMMTLETNYHTKAVQFNIKIAFMLFILTEIMFFFSMFWAFFHGSLSPSVTFNGIWPPEGLIVINAFSTPLWSTWVLWVSSIYALYIKDLIFCGYKKNWKWILQSFKVLILLALCFIACQGLEFYFSTFSFREGLYGSIFYLLTGFHGLHVVIGMIFLLICYFRLYFKLLPAVNGYLDIFKLNLKKPWKKVIIFKGCFIVEHFSGLEAAILYWQFVDIVWVLVWFIVYAWGNTSLSGIVI